VENTDDLSDYYARLRDELNPGLFVSEYMSHRIMNVEWSIAGDPVETIRTCIFEIRVILATRGFSEKPLLEILARSSSGDELKKDFLYVWNCNAGIHTLPKLESLAVLAIYCFTQVLFQN
jgi:hypothetical protein